MESHKELRRCNKCQAKKQLVEFVKDMNHLSGYQHQCKACKNETNRKNYMRSERDDTRSYYGQQLDPATTKMRPCLRCDEVVETDVRHRLCPACRYYIHVEQLDDLN